MVERGCLRRVVSPPLNPETQLLHNKSTRFHEMDRNHKSIDDDDDDDDDDVMVMVYVLYYYGRILADPPAFVARRTKKQRLLLNQDANARQKLSFSSSYNWC